MKSSSKMMVTGAFGGLVAVVVAGSGAFACTAEGQVGVRQNGAFVTTGGRDAGTQPPVVAAGSTMIYMTKAFEVGKTVYVAIQSPFTGEERILGEALGPSFEQPIGIPADWYSSTASKPYKLLAYHAGGMRKSSDVYIVGGPEWKAALPGPLTGDDPGTREEPPVIPGAVIGAPDAPLGSSAQGVVAAPQGASQAAAVPAASQDAPPADQPGTGGLTVPGQAVSAPIPLGPPVPPENTAPPSPELWSGLKADGSVNLLEPAGGATPPSGGVPAGGVGLLGAGILSLAGVAFEGTRRRLALAKVARRR